MLDVLNLRLHLTTGETVTFLARGTDAVQNILAQTWRGKFFTEQSLIIADGTEVNAFPGSAIARVDLLVPNAEFEELNQIKVTLEQPYGREISEEEWRTATGRSEPLPKTTLHEGDTTIVHTAFSLKDGEHLYLRIAVSVPSGNEQRRFLHNLFATPVIPFHNRQGGISLINPVNIVRSVFHPAPEAPLGAWQAQERPQDND